MGGKGLTQTGSCRRPLETLEVESRLFHLQHFLSQNASLKSQMDLQQYNEESLF